MILIVAAAIFVTIRYDAPALLRNLLAWIDAQGATGIIVFAATYIIATVLFIPGSILTLGAGFVFGAVGGTLATLGGATEQRGGAQWVIYGLGLVATVAVTVFVTQLARRALRNTLPADSVELQGASS